MKRPILFSLLFLLVVPAVEARIVLRAVKEPPKFCGVMKEDPYLSKENKIVYGTLKYSVVIEDKVSLISDLGKKACQWSIEDFAAYGDVDRFSFYIDEYQNTIYPFIKNEENNSYTMLKIPLVSCQVEDMLVNEKLELPKCSKPSPKTRGKRSKHLARS